MVHSLIMNMLNELESLVASNSRLYLEEPDALFLFNKSRIWKTFAI